MEKLKGLFKSRKFWAALVGLVMVVVKAYDPDFPINEEQMASFVYLLVAYILGVALEDGLSGRDALPVDTRRAQLQDRLYKVNRGE